METMTDPASTTDLTVLQNVSTCLLDYLVDITASKRVPPANKLAAMTIFCDILKNDKKGSVRETCLHSGLLTSLLTAMDVAQEALMDVHDVTYIEVAMVVLWQISTVSIGHMQTLITEPLIRRLLGFLDVSSNFYQYSGVVKSEMKSLCENKHLVATVKSVPMTTDLVANIHKNTRGGLKQLLLLPETVQACVVMDTNSPETDVDVAQHLISKHLAWPDNKNSAGDDKDAKVESDTSEDQDNWQDVMVTQVLDGTYFWAHIGEATIQSVRNIQNQLMEEFLSLAPCVVKTSFHVVVSGPVDGVSCLMRGQVLDVSDGMVTVFAVDYGCLVTVSDHQVYSVPASVAISRIPAQASLCKLTGKDNF
jgi:hypothetical protein